MVVALALTGLVFGHALELVFTRFYTDQPIGGPVYRCERCRERLRPAFLLPLAGVVFYRRRCPGCHERLPARALILPVGSATLFAVSWLVFESFGVALLGGVFASVFLLLTLTDLDRRLLPNRIVYPSILLAAAFSWAWPESSTVEVLAGGAVAVIVAATLLLLSLPFGANAFGMGDIKMIVLMGFVTGFPEVVVAVFIGTIAGGVGAALLLMLRLRTRRDYIPHGPYLALGAVIGLFWGQDIWDWYRD